MKNNSLIVHDLPFSGKNTDVALQVLGFIPDGYILCTLNYDHAVIWVDGKAFFSFLVKLH